MRHVNLLLCLILVPLAAALAAHSGGVSRWRLPLGIAPNENTGALAAAADDTTLYTADSRGTIFAVEATTGRVRWSIPGSASLAQIFVFPSIPELLYYLSWDLDTEGHMMLRAVRKTDGSEVARLHNLTSNFMLEFGPAAVRPTDYGLAILHDLGLYSTDRYLNVQWKVDSIAGNPITMEWFNHMATSGTLIAVVQRTGFEVLERTLSFDAKTGRLLCNISNISASDLEFLGAPFLISADGWSLMDYTLGSPDAVELLARAVNLQHCEVQRTTRINSAAVSQGLTLIPAAEASGAPLFFALSRASLDGLLQVNWTITHSRIGSNATLWNLTLPSPPFDPLWGAGGQGPLLSKASGIEDAVLLWYTGTFSAIDTETGAVRWSLAPTTVPTSPPLSVMDPQTVFPLGGGGRLFIPNLLGYTAVDTYSGEVLEVIFTEPILATLQFRDPTTGAASVVYVNAFGEVVGV